MSVKRKIDISYSNIEDAIASFLIATSVIADNEEVVDIDIPVKHDKDGIVKLTVTIAKA